MPENNITVEELFYKLLTSIAESHEKVNMHMIHDLLEAIPTDSDTFYKVITESITTMTENDNQMGLDYFLMLLDMEGDWIEKMGNNAQPFVAFLKDLQKKNRREWKAYLKIQVRRTLAGAPKLAVLN